MRLLAALNRAWLSLIGDARRMTEAEWLGAGNPTPMLEYLGRRVSERKLRLFACACCRRHWTTLPDERGRAAVDAAERYAEGVLNGEALEAARGEASRALADFFWTEEEFGFHHAAVQTLTPDTWHAALYASASIVVLLDRDAANREDLAQCALLRCLFGNPFRRFSWDPAWLPWHDGLIASMARRAYEGRDFSVLPVLADALEEAGCGDAAILNHCREASEHARGCWVIDLLLGKT